MIPGITDNMAGDGRLMQIKSQADHRSLELLDIWTCIIPAKLSSRVLNHIKDTIPPEPHGLNHLRRLVKQDSSSDETLLCMVICTVDCEPNLAKVQALIDEAAAGDAEVKVTRKYASKYQAYSKEQAAEWSAKSWPIMWRGNPSAVETQLSDSEVATIKQHLCQLVQTSNKHSSSELALATMIVDPVQDKVMLTVGDCRSKSGNPLDHSVMIALHEAAHRESERRKLISRSNSPCPSLGPAATSESPASSTPDSSSTTSSATSASTTLNGLTADEQNYLCLNMHVYTTHEPCPMCAMALVHSRIARLVYIKSSPSTGGIEPTSGAGHGIHWNKMLNWRYEAWKWMSEGYEASAEDTFISAVEAIPAHTNA